MSTDFILMLFLVAVVLYVGIPNLIASATGFEYYLFLLTTVIVGGLGLLLLWEYYSQSARDRRGRIASIKELPLALLLKSPNSIEMGRDEELETSIYLPNSIRTRHVHIVGS